MTKLIDDGLLLLFVVKDENINLLTSNDKCARLLRLILLAVIVCLAN